MSTLLEINNDEDWNKFSAAVPATTLQIIYFKAEWAAPVSISNLNRSFLYWTLFSIPSEAFQEAMLTVLFSVSK
jgi:hypothetical protein